MTGMQRLCLILAMALGFAALLNYIPGLTDAEGRAFGIFALDLFDDALHLASAIWAFWAGTRSPFAARFFLRVFGALYLADGLMGFVWGSGFLDFGIFTYGAYAQTWVMASLANLPHLALGSLALWGGFRGARA